MIIEKLRAAFLQQFGKEGALYTSLGRINLIGKHVDYNSCYVLLGG